MNVVQVGQAMTPRKFDSRTLRSRDQRAEGPAALADSGNAHYMIGRISGRGISCDHPAVGSVDVRRHAQRLDVEREDSELSPRGRGHSLQLAAAAPRYAVVAASPLRRAQDTAELIAGRKPEVTEDLLPALPAAVNARYERLSTLADWRGLIDELEEARLVAEAQVAVWDRLAAAAGPRGHALAVTHGGLIELAAVHLARRLGAHLEGPSFGYGQGVRIAYEDGVAVAITRLGG